MCLLCTVLNRCRGHGLTGVAGQDFWFPAFDLEPGQACRVYTNEHHPEHCGFNYGSGRALWKNEGDCSYLYDANGVEVSRYCY